MYGLARTLPIAATACALPAHAQPAPGFPVTRDRLVARIADLQRIHTPEGIELLEPVQVNGSTQ